MPIFVILLSIYIKRINKAEVYALYVRSNRMTTRHFIAHLITY